MKTKKLSTTMDKLFNLRVNGFWYGLTILILSICSTNSCFAQDVNRWDNIKGVSYHTYTYPNVDWHDRGYGESVALEYYGGSSSFVTIQPTLEFEIPDINSTAGVHESQTFPVVEIADQFCNRTNYLDGGYVTCQSDGLGIPKYIRRIGVDAFAGCTKLTGIDFKSECLEVIAERAFKGCTGIKNMNINSCSKLRSIGDEAFYNCSSLTSIYLPESVQEIGYSAFENCTELTHVSLPEALATINDGTFYGCKNLNSIVLPRCITTIRSQAFAYSGISGCLFLPLGLKEIRYGAFRSCENLRGPLNFTDSVLEIGSQAFMDCPNISGSLTFGKSVKRIGDEAFKNIGQIDAVIVKAQNPPNGDRFPDIIYQNAVLYVPIGTASIYSQADIWKDFTVIKEVEYQDPEKIEVTIGKRTVTSAYEDNLIVLESGSKTPIHTVVTPSSLATNQVFWDSSDTLVCQIKDGNLEMKTDGSATLTAWTCNNLSVKFKVEGGTPISTIELPDTVDVELGYTSLISYTALPEGKHLGKISWEISDPSVAKITSSDGQLEGVNMGETTLIATAGDGWGASDTCIVRVIPPHVKSISIKNNNKYPEDQTIIYGVNTPHTPLQLKAVVSPYNAIQDVIWTSSNENIATVDSNGLVTLNGYGNVSIRATSVEDPQKYDECKISLEYEVSLKLNDSDYWLGIVFYHDEEQPKFEVTCNPKSLPITDIVFSTTDEDIFKVEPDGKATWINKGMGYLRCNYKISGVEKQKSFTVYCSPARYITSLSFKEPSIEVIDYDNFKIDLTNLDIIPADAEYNQIEWSVLDETILRIEESSDQEASFSTCGIGETDIIAKAKKGGAQAICHVSVLPLPISDIKLSGNEIMEVGNINTIYASIEPYHASTKSLTWEVSDSSIVIITDSNSYKASVEAVGVGETDVIAKADVGDATAKLHIIVQPTPIKSLYLNQSGLTGKIGEKYQLEASFAPLNTTNKTIIWESTSPRIASVDNTGKVTLKNVGYSTIIATSEENPEIYDTCTIAVIESSEIENVIDKEEPFVRIYTIEGILIYEGLYSEAILSPGYYILNQNGKVVKLHITSKSN